MSQGDGERLPEAARAMSGRYHGTGRYLIPDLLSLSRVQVFGQTVEDAWHFYLFTKTELVGSLNRPRGEQTSDTATYHVPPFLSLPSQNGELYNCRPSPKEPNK